PGCVARIDNRLNRIALRHTGLLALVELPEGGTIDASDHIGRTAIIADRPTHPQKATNPSAFEQASHQTRRHTALPLRQKVRNGVAPPRRQEHASQVTKSACASLSPLRYTSSPSAPSTTCACATAPARRVPPAASAPDPPSASTPCVGCPPARIAGNV